MEIVAIAFASFVASGLTLFSGFGLGTILTPVFALFFPLEISVAMTAIVHLLNNLYKLSLLGKFADWPVLVRFGLPAIPAALLGAWLLSGVSHWGELFHYSLGDANFVVTPLRLSFALLLALFAVLELVPLPAMNAKWLWLGGVFSGFFGGLSGHQGALRSAFLAKAIPSKEAFLGTGVVLACVVDLLRVPFYGMYFEWSGILARWPLLAVAVFAALLGARIAVQFAHKVSMNAVRGIVAVGLFLLAVGLGAGWL